MKNAQMMSTRKTVSFVLGLVFLILGIIPVLNSFKIISFMLPVLPAIVLTVLALIGGIFLIYDGISEGQMASFGFGQYMMFASYIVGLGILVLGGVPLLNQFGLLSFQLPTLAQVIIDWLYVTVGILLFYGGSQGF